MRPYWYPSPQAIKRYGKAWARKAMKKYNRPLKCKRDSIVPQNRRGRVPSPVVRLARVKDKIVGVTLGGMRVTAKEFNLIQLAYHDGFQAGRASRG